MSDDAYYDLASVGPYAPMIGSALITMVEPHVGHERGYNRWYEDDHFNAGAMAMPWMFAGRRWVEVLNRTVLERVPFLRGGDPLFLHNLALMLKPLACAAGDVLIREHGNSRVRRDARPVERVARRGVRNASFGRPKRHPSESRRPRTSGRTPCPSPRRSTTAPAPSSSTSSRKRTVRS